MNSARQIEHRKAFWLELLSAISIAAGLSFGASAAGYRVEEQATTAAAASTPTSYLVYRPSTSGAHAKSPVVVALYGAGGSMNASNFGSDEFAEIRRELSQAGYVTIVPELGPSHWMNDDAIAKLDDALNELSRDESLDAKRVHLLGSSMGGGSALAYAVRRPERVASVISHMGMTDFAAWIAENPGYTPALAAAYGGTYREAVEQYDSRSAVRNAAKLKNIRTLVVHGADDETVLPSHSVTLYRALTDHGNDCTLRLIEGVGHTNELVGGLSKDIVAFLEDELPRSPVAIDHNGRTSVKLESTADGTQYRLLAPPSAQPAPALVVLSGNSSESLNDPYFLQCGLELLGLDYVCVSVDLPCHGSEQRRSEQEGLAGWSERVDADEPFVQEFTGKLSRVLDELVAKKVIDANRIAICGTSRGAFLACHAAAADPRIKAVACMAPVTSLNALAEFKCIDHPKWADRASLVSVSPKLAGRPVWISIGDQDERVGVAEAIAFSRRLTAESLRQGVPSRVELHVVPEPRGHTTPLHAPAQAAKWIEEILRQPAG